MKRLTDAKGRSARALLMVALIWAPTTLAGGPAPDIPLERMIFVNAGVLTSVSKRPTDFLPVGALGLEASVHTLPSKSPLGFGLFGQWQSVNFQHHRFCGGLQTTLGFLGLELGMTHETASSKAAATTSLHVAPFVSTFMSRSNLMFLTAGLRVDTPLTRATGDMPGHGRDIGLVLAVKGMLPLVVR